MIYLTWLLELIRWKECRFEQRIYRLWQLAGHYGKDYG